jgi:hypothetical protein
MFMSFPLRNIRPYTDITDAHMMNGRSLEQFGPMQLAHMILTLSSFLLLCYSVVHFPLGDNTAALIIVLRFPGRMDTSYGISQC